MGRPSKIKKTLVKEILSRFADGESLTSICRDEHMPKRNTIYRWRSQYPEFGEAYIQAQEQHTDALVDLAGLIVDEEPNPQRAKVRADHRRWLATRLNRKKYGDKIEVTEKVKFDISGMLDAAQERLKLVVLDSEVLGSEIGDVPQIEQKNVVENGLLTQQNASIEDNNSDMHTM